MIEGERNMIKIDADRAASLLMQAVKERGHDFVYERVSPGATCLYVHDRTRMIDGQTQNVPESEWTPGCIVGLVLKTAGIALSDMAFCEGKSSSELINILTHQGKIQVSDAARRIFTVAQTAQDDGQTWGYAVMAALRSSARAGETYQKQTEKLEEKAVELEKKAVELEEKAVAAIKALLDA